MAASRKKRTALRAVIIFILCLALICVVGAAILFGLISNRLKAFQTGTTFSFDYQITATADEPPTLYRLLEHFGALQGHLSGQSGADSLQVLLYTQEERTTPVTRLYISPDDTLYDVGQIYANIRTAVVNEYPLASLLMPEWSLGDYISQNQLADLLGVDRNNTSLQQVTRFQLEWKAMHRVQPEQAMDGYLYFQLTGEEGADAPVLMLGLAKENLLQTTSPMAHILLSFPADGITVELKGAITAAQTTMISPASRMQDEDIAALVQLRETIQSILQFVQQAA